METMKMKSILISAIFVLLFVGSICKIKAEGTATTSPVSTHICALGLLPDQLRGSYLGCAADQRIKIRIEDHTTENLYYGFSWRLYQSNLTVVNPVITNMFMRIYDPTGVQVGTPINLPSSGNGFISTFTQGSIGANIAGSAAGGYIPLTFDPSMNGDYYIQLYQSTDGGATQAATSTWSLTPFFDLQVANASGTRFDGRVHCNKWAFVAVDNAFWSADFDAEAEPTIHAWSTDSVILKFDFQSFFRPIAFDVAVTKYGLVDNGNWVNDRKSANSTTSPLLTNGYLLFLNPPDPAVYPACAIPANPILNNPVIVNCTAPFGIRYTLAAAGDVRIMLDFNGSPGFQPGTTDRVLEQFDVPAGANTMAWDGNNGLGAAVASGTQFKIYVQYLKGRFNVPLYDAEINKNGFSISAVAPIPNSALRVYWDDSNCPSTGGCSSTADNQLNATAAGLNNTFLGSISPAHAWSGNGNSAQAIPAPSVGTNETGNLQCDDFGNVRIINTFGWGLSSLDSADVQLGCLTASGTVWNDVNNSANGTNSNIFTSGENGTNVTNTLKATLVDPVTGNTIESVSVAGNGTYSYTKVPTYANGLISRITNTIGTAGSTAPAIATLPSGWVTTSPLTQNFNSVTSPITGLDFGVEELPTPQNLTATSQTNPGGTTNVTVPASTFGATDPSGGSITAIRITSFPTNATSITINGIQYTPGSFPGAGITVPTSANGQPTQTIEVDPDNGAVSVVIPYAAIDNANKEGTTLGSATQPLTVAITYTLSGNVFNDLNGLTDNTVNGSGLGNPSGTTLYANLISGANVSQTIAVAPNGSYSFSGVGAGNYTIQISSNQGTVGQPSPATALPSGWTNTGEFIGTGAGNDGSANGNLSFSVSGNMTDINFGIQQGCAANAGLIIKN